MEEYKTEECGPGCVLIDIDIPFDEIDNGYKEMVRRLKLAIAGYELKNIRGRYILKEMKVKDL